jgi:uncharacterized protein YjbI with pentapeptide repeats
MTARIRAHLRSNIVGYIALFCFAISGTAQALPGQNKVDSGDIKNFQVKKKDLAKNSVSGANVVDGSLSEADISPAALKAIFATGVVTSVQLADGTILTSDLADGSVTTPRLADLAVTGAKIAGDAVDSGKVADDSLTGTDLKGADVSGAGISIPTGYVPNGRCRQLDASVGGAEAGQAVLFSVQAALQDGVMIYGQSVPSDGHVMFDVCNLSGTTQAAINDMPVHVLTLE